MSSALLSCILLSQIWTYPFRRDRPDGLERALQRDPRSTRGWLAPLVSQTPGLVDGRAPDVMPAIRARSADGWPTLRGDEAGFADGAPVAKPALQALAELHTAGACHKEISMGISRHE